MIITDQPDWSNGNTLASPGNGVYIEFQKSARSNNGNNSALHRAIVRRMGNVGDLSAPIQTGNFNGNILNDTKTTEIKKRNERK
jgi:hypothetical protein